MTLHDSFTKKPHLMDKKCKKLAKITNFYYFWPASPCGNESLMAIEAWNMYKMPFKLNNPSFDMILSKITTTYWQQKTNFHCFWPTLSPGNGPFMVIESWNMYKMPLKSDNPSLDIILSQRNHNLWTKNAKIGQNDQFSLFFLPTLPPGNGPFMVIESWNMYKMPLKLDNPSLHIILSQGNHNLWTKNPKNGQNDQFSLI